MMSISSYVYTYIKSLVPVLFQQNLTLRRECAKSTVRHYVAVNGNKIKIKRNENKLMWKCFLPDLAFSAVCRKIVAVLENHGRRESLQTMTQETRDGILTLTYLNYYVLHIIHTYYYYFHHNTIPHLLQESSTHLTYLKTLNIPRHNLTI